jgi:hypothetical protein
VVSPVLDWRVGLVVEHAVEDDGDDLFGGELVAVADQWV